MIETALYCTVLFLYRTITVLYCTVLSLYCSVAYCSLCNNHTMTSAQACMFIRVHINEDIRHSPLLLLRLLSFSFSLPPPPSFSFSLPPPHSFSSLFMHLLPQITHHHHHTPLHSHPSLPLSTPSLLYLSRSLPSLPLSTVEAEQQKVLALEAKCVLLAKESLALQMAQAQGQGQIPALLPLVSTYVQ